MTQHSIHNQALALAGVAQFIFSAQEIAAHGRAVPDRLDAALYAVFCTNPQQADDVINDRAVLQDGIGYLHRQFGRVRPKNEDASMARNMGQVLRLTARLVRKPEALTGIRAAIDRARLAENGEAPSILNEAYQTEISPIPPRVMVQGHPSYLNNTLLVQQIRTHLLAAIRCAVLWRQCGGGFWRLIFCRRRYQQALAGLETEARTADP